MSDGRCTRMTVSMLLSSLLLLPPISFVFLLLFLRSLVVIYFLTTATTTQHKRRVKQKKKRLESQLLADLPSEREIPLAPRNDSCYLLTSPCFLSIAFPCPTHIAILKNHDQSRNRTASETHPHKTQHSKTPQSVEEDQTVKYAIARDKKKKNC
jgi:hypothetical protein